MQRTHSTLLIVLAVFDESEYRREPQRVIAEWINVNKVTARLLNTGEPVFSSFDIFGLWIMRELLETPIEEMNTEYEPSERNIPAAAAWISILGKEMYSWDKEFPYGHVGDLTVGDPGLGGPLWDGQHGFCKGRWQLWRKQFGELSSSDKLTEGLRQMCKEIEARMSEIEAQSE